MTPDPVNPPPAAITEARLHRFAPHCDAAAIAPKLAAAAKAFGISTPLRVAHWMAQMSEESGGFTELVENLDYSVADICRVWPTRFPTHASAQPFAHDPEALADRVYGGRMGNTRSGDGWRYRGRGFIPITGRATYLEASKWAGVDLVEEPDRAAEPAVAAVVAGYFWLSRGCNRLADVNAIGEITTKINAGVTNLAARHAAFVLAAAEWPTHAGARK